MGIRMKKLLPSHPWSNGRGSILLFLTLALAFLFVACGDDDSSSFVEPEKESSSSEILSSGDGTSDGNGDKSSSSVSSSSTNSSSSAKSSSSTDAKSSSSVTSSSSGTSAGSSSSVNSSNASSSSSSLKSCPPEKEGKTRTIVDSGEKQICQNGYWVPMESSSSADVSSSSYFDMTEQFNPDVEYGEFTDPRDGHKYRTVSLYDDSFERTYVFFAENLNYGKMVSGGTVQGDSTKYCYDDDPWYCENGWGGLYTWSNAMGFPAVCDSVSMYAEACSQKFVYPSEYAQPQNYVQHQGICPEGWHIVNAGEWAHLQQRTGGSVAHFMGSKVAGFGNENLYGMSLLPAGYWDPEYYEFKVMRKATFYWMPQQYSGYDDCAHRAAIWTDEIDRSSRGLKKQGFSVRCVKNY